MSPAPQKNQRGQAIALAVLVAVAAALLWRAQGITRGLSHFIGGGNGDAAVAALLRQPNPTLHWGYLRAVRSIRYRGDLRNLFAPAPLAAAPSADPRNAANSAAAAAAAANAGPPGPPPIPLKFYGYATRAGAAKRVFLRWNKKIFIAAEGQVVAHRYKILRIDPKAVAIQDLAEQRTEVVPLILPPNAG